MRVGAYATYFSKNMCEPLTHKDKEILNQKRDIAKQYYLHNGKQTTARYSLSELSYLEEADKSIENFELVALISLILQFRMQREDYERSINYSWLKQSSSLESTVLLEFTVF